MKRLVMGIALACLTALPALAGGYSDKNPDHLPSFSFGVGLGKNSGDTDVFAFGTKLDNQDFDGDWRELLFAYKVPVSDTVTFGASLAFGTSSQDADETSVLFGSKSDATGWGLRLGVTKYFGR